MPELRKKALIQLKEHLVGWTLREIRNLFDSAEIPCSEEYEPREQGERRSLVAKYYHSLDLTKPEDLRKILNVFQDVLAKAKEAAEDPNNAFRQQATKDLQMLTRLLNEDGFGFVDGRVVALDATSSVGASNANAVEASIPSSPKAAGRDSTSSPNKQQVRKKPRLFVGSSVEGLELAKAIHTNLDFDAEVTVWNSNVFLPSITTMENLASALVRFDFAAFVLSPDDVATMRGHSYSVARDNVIFELGLFIGRLGRDRVFFLLPRGEGIHLPTDLLGVTPLTFDPNRQDRNLVAALAPACTKLGSIMRDMAMSAQPSD